MIEELSLQVIENRLESILTKVSDASYTYWDYKCNLLSKYRKLLDCIDELKKNEKYITDDAYVDRLIQSLIR